MKMINHKLKPSQWMKRSNRRMKGESDPGEQQLKSDCICFKEAEEKRLCKQFCSRIGNGREHRFLSRP